MRDSEKAQVTIGKSKEVKYPGSFKGVIAAGEIQIKIRSVVLR